MITVVTTSHRSLNERGTAFVELAIVIPILIIAIVGVVDYGRELREHSVLVEAARVGARTAGMRASGASSSDINEAARDAATAFITSSGYEARDFELTIEPRQISLSNAGTIDMIRLRVRRKDDAQRWMLSGRLLVKTSATAAFTLAQGNRASAETTGIGT